MGRKKIGDVTDNAVKKRLRRKGKDGQMLIDIMEFSETRCVQDLTLKLEEDFSDNGNSHYPRYFLLVIVMYCFYRRLFFYRDIEYALKNDEILKIYTRGMPVCKNTIRNFLEDSDSHIIRQIFLFTLVQLNDFGLLSFLHYFIDGTDALVRASKTHIIYEEEIIALEQMKEWKSKLLDAHEAFWKYANSAFPNLVTKVSMEHIDAAGYWFTFELINDNRRQTYAVRHEDLL